MLLPLLNYYYYYQPLNANKKSCLTRLPRSPSAGKTWTARRGRPTLLPTKASNQTMWQKAPFCLAHPPNQQLITRTLPERECR